MLDLCADWMNRPGKSTGNETMHVDDIQNPVEKDAAAGSSDRACAVRLCDDMSEGTIDSVEGEQLACPIPSFASLSCRDGELCQDLGEDIRGCRAGRDRSEDAHGDAIPEERCEDDGLQQVRLEPSGVCRSARCQSSSRSVRGPPPDHGLQPWEMTQEALWRSRM